MDFAGVWISVCGGLLSTELVDVAEEDFLEDVVAGESKKQVLRCAQDDIGF